MEMKQTIERISAWLRDKVIESGAQGLVVGLSGGIDSACTAALAQRAVGKQVLGVLMPCYSAPADAEYARMAAEAFGLETVTVELGPVYDALMAALPAAEGLAPANIKPRLRMTTLYYLAATRNYLVAGTGNKSELLVGYFTKYGDGGVDLEPLGNLYKTEVRELARALGVPQPIIDRPPTAGLWPDQTDESEMGLTYAELDATLAAMEVGDTGGIAPAVLAKVTAMVRGSAHKRAAPPSCELE